MFGKETKDKSCADQHQKQNEIISCVSIVQINGEHFFVVTQQDYYIERKENTDHSNINKQLFVKTTSEQFKVLEKREDCFQQRFLYRFYQQTRLQFVYFFSSTKSKQLFTVESIKVPIRIVIYKLWNCDQGIDLNQVSICIDRKYTRAVS